MKNDTTLINDVLKHIPNKYMAVIVASKRARAINDGLAPSVRTGAAKPTTMALEEISEGLVTEKTPLPERKKVDIEEERLPILDDESEEEEEEEPLLILDSESEEDDDDMEEE